MQDLKKRNTDLLYAISDGSRSDMDAWAGADVFDFFMGLWSRQDAIARQEKQLKAQK